MSSDHYGGIAGELADEGDEGFDDEDAYCDHDHDEECYDYQGFLACTHQHCWNCGGCNCPGYCDDFSTYNLRFSETGGTDPEGCEPTS